MSHRTLNPRTAFYGDMRNKVNPEYRNRGMKKANGAQEAYRQEFGKKPPHFYGSIPNHVYPELERTGWKFSSKYGWRKVTA